jgi:large subunit ribosomal protein L25
MQTRPVLQATRRGILGKKVKTLRREGKLPANIYGKGLKSIAIQINTKDFESVYKEVGETGLIDLILDGEAHPVLIKSVQMKYPLHTPLHVDFHQVNLKEKVKAMIPIALVGEAKAVTDKIGTLIQLINEIEVEALPTDLPERIEVNVEHLANLNEQITVSDLRIPSSVNVLTDPGQIVVKIAELAAPEPEPVVEETSPEGETPLTNESTAKEDKTAKEEQGEQKES